jgi:hypothetical protein
VTSHCRLPATALLWPAVFVLCATAVRRIPCSAARTAGRCQPAHRRRPRPAARACRPHGTLRTGMAADRSSGRRSPDRVPAGLVTGPPGHPGTEALPTAVRPTPVQEVIVLDSDSDSDSDAGSTAGRRALAAWTGGPVDRWTGGPIVPRPSSVVRAVLVPSAMTLAGRLNWGPTGSRHRSVTRFDIKSMEETPWPTPTPPSSPS